MRGSPPTPMGARAPNWPPTWPPASPPTTKGQPATMSPTAQVPRVAGRGQARMRGPLAMCPEAGPQPAGWGGGKLTHACTRQSVLGTHTGHRCLGGGGVQGRSGQSPGAREMPRQAGAQASGQTSPFKAGSFPTTWTVCVDNPTPTRTACPAPPLPGVPASRHPDTAAAPPEQGAGPGPRAHGPYRQQHAPTRDQRCPRLWTTHWSLAKRCPCSCGHPSVSTFTGCTRRRRT